MFKKLVTLAITLLAVLASCKTRTEMTTDVVTELFEEPTLEFLLEPVCTTEPELELPQKPDLKKLFANQRFCRASGRVIDQGDLSLNKMFKILVTDLAESNMIAQNPTLGRGEALSMMHNADWYDLWHAEVWNSVSFRLTNSDKLEKLFRDNESCLVSKIRQSERLEEIQKLLQDVLIPTFEKDKWKSKITWAWRKECMEQGGQDLVSTWAYIFIRLSKALD